MARIIENGGEFYESCAQISEQMPQVIPRPEQSRTPGSGSLFSGPALNAQHLSAVQAYQVCCEVRSSLIFMGILVSIWALLIWPILLRHNPVELVVNFVVWGVLMLVFYFCYTRCSYGWVVTSGICMILLGCGLIPFVVGIQLLMIADKVKAISTRVSTEWQSWKQVKAQLNEIVDLPVSHWACWRSRRHPRRCEVRLRFFDDAALFLFFGRKMLVGRSCVEVTIDRKQAHTCQLELGAKGTLLTEFRPDDYSPWTKIVPKFKKIEMPEEVVTQWRTWCLRRDSGSARR